MNARDLVQPDWPAPERVRAFSTTRLGGVSRGPWESLNLSFACGDERDKVLANRRRLMSLTPSEPLWMRQVHGSRVLVDSAAAEDGRLEADARVTSRTGEVAVVLSADCLPVLLCDDRGTRVAAAHAGWRGVAGGVIEATVAAMAIPPERLLAWLGPAIGGEVYEVGNEVRESFAGSRTLARQSTDGAFTESGERWRLDLAGAARIILAGLGVGRVNGGDFCTFSDPTRFYSHRRDGVTGRMASLIWLEGK